MRVIEDEWSDLYVDINKLWDNLSEEYVFEY